jgi:hypothetical protein
LGRIFPPRQRGTPQPSAHAPSVYKPASPVLLTELDIETVARALTNGDVYLNFMRAYDGFSDEINVW